MSTFPRSFLSVIILLAILKPKLLNSQSPECGLDDFRALNSFYGQLSTPIDGWEGPVSECCHRPGVVCENSTGIPSRVVGLSLGNRRLIGGIADSITNLGQLRILNLSHNDLHGLVPVNLFQMRNLEVLDLSYNSLHGSFDADVNLPAVKSLNLSNNNFAGPMEAALCRNASGIETLDLFGNYFTGEIPEDISDCSSLQYLFLDGNELSGELPEGIFELRNLQALHLQGNRFSGKLHERIGELVHLVKLDISENSFSGQIPDSFSRLVKLSYFSAVSNRFSGPLPYSLVNSPSLSVLYLGNNTLSGRISINCSSMLHIAYLDLRSNMFDGPIPKELSACSGLIYLNLGRNRLISSELPSSFRNLEALKHLLLMNTSLVNFSAALETLQHCSNLTTLILNGNFWNEEIPQNPNLQFESLNTLIIANSRLRGSLPIWLSGCTNLRLLDLSWNQLSGKIPSWIGELGHLFYLDLSLNSLHGQLPESLGKLGFDLVNLNSSSMTDPSSIFSVYLSRPGRVPLMYNRIWSLPPTLDLSDNNLTGPIIPGLGNLTWLHVLKLKNNSFSGSIPDDLSGLVNLETMDLSMNNLSGRIPLSLTSLHFLSSFNISFNKLSGMIPDEGQFATFPNSSFLGNSDLCGYLLGPCGRFESILPGQENPEEQETSVVAQLRIPFGVGAATGFVITVGLCFGSGWVLKS